jgi:hypothetical protein
MTGSDTDTSLLGPWTPSELAETANSEVGVGVDNDASPSVRFKSNVAKLLRRRNARPEASYDPAIPAVFLLQPTPPEPARKRAPRREPMLDDGMKSVTGRIWFVAPPVVSGHYFDLDVNCDDDIFRVVTEELALGTCPAVLFNPCNEKAEARYYPKGLGEPDECEIIEWGTAEISLDDIFTAIERIYEQSLKTPEGLTDASLLWHDPEKWISKKRAEAFVQQSLKDGLIGAFPTCDIRHEQTTPEGRTDIEIEERDPLDSSKVTRHAILEIKVLRSFWETGRRVSKTYTSNWVRSGIKQAAIYRDSKGARVSALCCFDMRSEDTGDECFTPVVKFGAKLSVTLKRWYLYSKSEYLREARTSCN